MWLVALAGPAVNLALAGLFLALYWLAMKAGAAAPPRFYEPFVFSAFVTRALYLPGAMNLALAVIKLLPAYPFDGGIIAEELLPRIGVRRPRTLVSLFTSIIGFVGVLAAFVVALGGFGLFMPPMVRAHPALRMRRTVA